MKKKSFRPSIIESIAQEIHNRWYIREKLKHDQLPKPTFKEWHNLNEETKNANRSQALDILNKLNSLGYSVIKNRGLNKSMVTFTNEEMETMAKMEHDRWNAEKIKNGWVYGKVRNDAMKIHDCLLDWEELPEGIKNYDRDAVNSIPGILSSLGFFVIRTKQ